MACTISELVLLLMLPIDLILPIDNGVSMVVGQMVLLLRLVMYWILVSRLWLFL